MHYLYYKKKSKSKYYLIAALLIFIISAVILLWKSDNKTAHTVNPVENTINTEIIKDGILKTKYNYLCSHSEYTEEKIPSSYIGKTVEYIKEKHDEIKSINYDNNTLNVEIDKAVKCDKHYRIQLVDDIIAVYCEKFPDKAEKKLKINLTGLYETEIELLKSGIEFGSKEALLEFLEDFES